MANFASLALPLALPLALIAAAAPANAREVVEASEPQALAVTLYRDPSRGERQAMNRNWPKGFAMITETRRVTLPPGQSTIRFDGVAEGMVAVSAIITGLPGGTIEKNRNADLLSPAALVDGTLGNRVTITRTNPATGKVRSESAVVRTRADGGLVLQTQSGFEAVRCSGLPEKLTFDRVPDGLSALPVFSIDTRDESGGTYDIELTYLAAGFDWQANYVAHLQEGGRGKDMKLSLVSWLTLLNDNGQSFPDAELLVVAGRLNVQSDFRDLSDPPTARPLRLTCYPLGSTKRGSPIPVPPPPPRSPQPSAPMMMRAAMAFEQSDDASNIVVTGSRMMAAEEDLGDLKLYRVPERVTVSAKGMKQIAFLSKDEVEGELLYLAACSPWAGSGSAGPAEMLFVTVNDKRHGLGVALPMGGIAFFEPSSVGDLLVGEEWLRDHAEGQDVELKLGTSAQVFAQCDRLGGAEPQKGWADMRAILTNANPWPVTLRLELGSSSQFHFRGLRRTRVKDGDVIYEVTIPANGRREIIWKVRSANVS